MFYFLTVKWDEWTSKEADHKIPIESELNKLQYNERSLLKSK